MIRIKKIKITLLAAGFFLTAFPVLARENVTDWYIKDFQTEITVNKDSSLDIVEKITADCGNASGKHGIFRIIPETINFPNKKIKTPVELVSITDFSNAPLKYSQSKNRSDNTITWKIGDPNRTVTGVNEYLIKYRVENAIRADSSEFDELYWNLNGNFWELETDNFMGKIIFPPEITQNNSDIDYYTGRLDSIYKNLAVYRWSSNNILEFNSTRTLYKGEGITVSAAFPKNIITPYRPGFFEIYGKYFWLIIPLSIFACCFRSWRKFGKDPKIRKTVIAQYDPPGKLSPLEMGMLAENGIIENSHITAEIIYLATEGFIKIKELNEKVWVFKWKDYELERIENETKYKTLSEAQKIIINKLFKEGPKIKLSELKNSFHKITNDIESKANIFLRENGYLASAGKKYQIAFILAGILMFIASFFLFQFSVHLALNIMIGGILFFIFGLVMPKRTPKGAELNWEIKGFKLFMETAEKYRAQFNERENIFEKLLPYAIVFDMTKEWIKKMEKIYGSDYYAHYSPVWYSGTLTAFSMENFSDSIQSLSKSIAANTSASSSGAGGGGSSGGGGGGGGGGGW